MPDRKSLDKGFFSGRELPLEEDFFRLKPEGFW